MRKGEALTPTTGRQNADPPPGSAAHLSYRARTNEPSAAFHVAEFYGCLCHRPTTNLRFMPPSHHAGVPGSDRIEDALNYRNN